MKNNRNIFILVGLLLITAAAAFLALPSLFTIWSTDRGSVNNDPKTILEGPFRSDEGIDPNFCNAIHNIDACSPEELEALGLFLPEKESSQYWMEIVDTGHGFRYAIPCYWRVQFPENYARGSGPSYPIYNYTEEFVQSFPRGEGVFENGGVKIDMGVINLPFFRYGAGTSLQEYATNASNTEYSQILSLEELTVNGQGAIKVSVHYSEYDTVGTYILFKVSDEIFLQFSAAPSEALDSADVLGVLNSLALSPENKVQVPAWRPSDPPQGVPALCMGIN